MSEAASCVRSERCFNHVQSVRIVKGSAFVRKSKAFSAVVCVAALAVAACSSSGGGASNTAHSAKTTPHTASATTPSKQLTIGLSLPSSVNGFYAGLAAGVKQEADKLNVKLQTAYADNSVATQASQIRAFTTSGVDGVLVGPADATALNTTYSAVQQANIPIMSMANDISDPTKEDGFIGADWGKYGHDIAEWTCAHYQGTSGEVAMILGPAGLSFVKQMADPYKSYIENSCPKLKIVFTTNLTDQTAANALPAAQNALTAHPGIDVIFCENDPSADGAIQAVAKANRIGKVMVTGFDGDPIGLANVNKGTQAMTITLNPLAWGALALKTLVDAVNGHKPAQHLVPIETQLLDHSNIAAYCAQNKCS